MIKLLFRLLLVFITIYSLSNVVELYATEGGHPSSPTPTPPPPPPPKQPTVTDTQRFKPPRSDWASGVGGIASSVPAGGCGGGPSATPPSPPETPDKEDTEIAKADKEKIDKVKKDSEKEIKSLEDKIKDYTDKKETGTSTFTDKQLDTYIEKAKDQIKNIKKDTQVQIAQIEKGAKGDTSPTTKSPDKTDIPHTDTTTPDTTKGDTGKPVTTKPDKPVTTDTTDKTDTTDTTKPDKPGKTSTDTEKRQLEKEKYDLRQNMPKDVSGDPNFKQSVDNVAFNLGIVEANQQLGGTIPSILDTSQWKKDAAELAGDTLKGGPAGFVASLGKKVIEKTIEYTGNVFVVAPTARTAVDAYYQAYTDPKGDSWGKPANEYYLKQFATMNGAPKGREMDWIAAYCAARKRANDNMINNAKSAFNEYSNSRSDNNEKPLTKDSIAKEKQMKNGYGAFVKQIQTLGR